MTLRCHLSISSGSELEAVVLAPLLHHLHKVLHLGVLGVFQHLNHFDQPLFILLAGYHHLKYSDRCAALALPEFGVRVEPFKYVEGLD